MGTLLSSIIAIILFSVLLVAGLMYIDSDTIEAEGKAPLYASQIGDLVEAAQKFRTVRGNWPTSMEDLQSEFEISGPQMKDTALSIDSGFACLSVPLTRLNEQSLISARDRFVVDNGSEDLPANVSNKCGAGSAIADKLVLAVALNGTDIAAAGGYDFPEEQSSVRMPPYTCGATPAPGDNVNNRGKFLGCYADHVEEGYARWVADGKGLVPPLSAMVEGGYVMPFTATWSDKPTYIGPSGSWAYGGDTSNAFQSPPRYYISVFYGTSSSFGNLSRAMQNQSNGVWTSSTYYNYHNYSGRIFFRTGDPVPAKALTWNEPIPTNSSPYHLRVRYVAHWLLKTDAAGRAWYAAGNTALPTHTNLMSYGAPPPPGLSDYSTIGISASSGCDEGPCIRMWAPEDFVKDVQNASYRVFKESTYYGWHSYGPKLR